MMSLNDSTLTAMLTWGGGVVTWGLAAFFEWLSQDISYKRDFASTKAVADHDPAYASTVGDIATYLANLGIHRPSFYHAFFRNSPQPLLVVSIIALTVFRPANFSDWVHHVVAAVVGVVGVVTLTCLHEFKGKTDWAKSGIYHTILYLSWVAYFLLVLWMVPSSVSAHGG